MSNKFSLPGKFHKFFWDIDVSGLDIHVKSKYVIERLLEYGDLDAIGWVRGVYGDKQMIDVVFSSSKIGARSANYYATLFKLPKNEIRCLHKDYQSRHRKIWPH